jgi:hypothetical protein
VPEPERRVIIAKSPEGKTIVIGAGGSPAASGALRVTLARHGWTPGEDAPYKSRAEWLREQVAAAARHRDQAREATGRDFPPGDPAPRAVCPEPCAGCDGITCALGSRPRTASAGASDA